jgi:hypothetical protein
MGINKIIYSVCAVGCLLGASGFAAPDYGKGAPLDSTRMVPASPRYDATGYDARALQNYQNLQALQNARAVDRWQDYQNLQALQNYQTLQALQNAGALDRWQDYQNLQRARSLYEYRNNMVPLEGQSWDGQPTYFELQPQLEMPAPGVQGF